MQTKIQQQGDFSIIILEGEIDIHCAPELRTQVLDELGKKQNVILDMASVSYIDSSGIATLVEGLQQSRSQDRMLALASISNSVTQVLQLTRLDEVFTIFESTDAAMAGA